MVVVGRERRRLATRRGVSALAVVACTIAACVAALLRRRPRSHRGAVVACACLAGWRRESARARERERESGEGLQLSALARFGGVSSNPERVGRPFPSAARACAIGSEAARAASARAWYLKRGPGAGGGRQEHPWNSKRGRGSRDSRACSGKTKARRAPVAKEDSLSGRRSKARRRADEGRGESNDRGTGGAGVGGEARAGQKDKQAAVGRRTGRGGARELLI